MDMQTPLDDLLNQMDTEVDALVREREDFEKREAGLASQNTANDQSIYRGRYELIAGAYRFLMAVVPKKQEFATHFKDRFTDLGDRQALEHQVVRLVFGHPHRNRKKSASNRNYSHVIKWLWTNNVASEKAAETIEYGIEPKDGYKRKPNGDIKKEPINGIAKIVREMTKKATEKNNKKAQKAGIEVLQAENTIATGKLGQSAPKLSQGMYFFVGMLGKNGKIEIKKAYGENDPRTAKEVRSHAPS